MSDEAFDAVVRELDRYAEQRLAPLTALAEQVAGLLADSPSAVPAADFDILEPLIRRQLADDPTMVGHGFAAGAGVVRDNDRFLQWFQHRATGIRRLTLNLTPGDPDLYDYFDTDWFSRAQQDRTAALFGPYVDYAGADFLVITAVVPVIVGGRFLGVAGADMLPDVIEHALVAIMRRLPGDAVIVGTDRSVMAANTARWLPGERLAIHPARDRLRWKSVGELPAWTGWTIALAADPS